MKNRITKSYNNFRSNIAPLLFIKVETGSISIDDYNNWFDQREETFFKIMEKNGI